MCIKLQLLYYILQQCHWTNNLQQCHWTHNLQQCYWTHNLQQCYWTHINVYLATAVRVTVLWLDPS